MNYYEAFNRSAASKFINSPAGRVMRICSGIFFLVIGYIYRSHPLGIASMVWGIFPLSAGALDICYISAALGGPVSGKQIRSMYP